MVGRGQWLDATPTARALLEVFRARPLGWFKGIGELVDNAFDWGASAVEFGWESPNSFYFRDNGLGCPDPGRLVKLGEHVQALGAARLGRYGIGAKDMFLWLWGTFHAESQSSAGAWLYDINWSRQQDWLFPQPQRLSRGRGPTGLSISVANSDQRRPSKGDLADLFERLAFTYSPALEAGLRIVCRNPATNIERIAPPALTEELTLSINLGERVANVRVGIVEEGVPNSYPGFSYAFQYRVIKPRSILGCGTYGSARVAGWVELVDDPAWPDNDPRKWKLTTNKDDFIGAEDLGAAIAEAAESLLKKASEQPRYIQVEELAKRAERRLNRMLRLRRQRVKGKREKGDQSGRHSATGVGSKPERFERSQPDGSTPERRPSPDSGLRIEIVDFNGMNPGLGEANLTDIVVRLNKQDRYVARCVTDQNEEGIANAAFTLFFAELQSGRLVNPLLARLTKGRDDQYWFGRMLSEHWL